MPDPFTCSAVAIYVADKIIGKIVTESTFPIIKNIFFPKKKHSRRLATLIDKTINHFKQLNQFGTSDGKFKFYDSEIIFSELTQHILFKTDYDISKIKSELEKNPNILIPSDKELSEFFNYFVELCKNDSKLSELYIQEHYRQEIFNISSEISLVIEYLQEIRSKFLNDELQQVKKIFTANSPLDVLVKKSTPLDLEILQAVRRQVGNNQQIERHYQIYSEGIDNISKSFIKSCLKIINSNIVDVYSDIPDLNIDIIPKERIIIKNGDDTLTLKNPKLLWECNCKIKFPPKYKRKKCPVHSKFSNDESSKNVTELFQNGLVEICVSDLKLLWNNQKNLWPPSMDSIYLVDDLKKNNYTKKYLNSIVDVGCGTGYLGIWLAKNNEHIKEALFTDWMLLPLIFSYVNSTKNNLYPTNCEFKLGLNTNWLSEQYSSRKFRLAICNPPYLPLFTGKEKFKDEMTVAGTELLCNFIENWANFAYEAIISFSDMVLLEAKESCEKSGSKLVPLGEKRTIPFRINAAFAEKRYISRLLKENRISFHSNSYFPYWHKVQSYKIEKLR